MPVVKSFGYGNDSIRTSKVALDNGVTYLAVAFPDEGATLRENRIEAPILVFNVLPEEVDKIVRYRLSSVVASLEVAHRPGSGCSPWPEDPGSCQDRHRNGKIRSVGP